LGLLHRRFRRRHPGLRRRYRSGRPGLGLQIVIQLALRNGLRLGQRGIARHVLRGLSQLSLRLYHLRLGLRQLSLALIERGLKWARIDLKQQLPLGNDRSFPVILANQVARNVRLDLRVHVAVHRGDPLAGESDIPPLHRSHLHCGGRSGGLRILPIRPAPT
jgi:hypothetical protein